MKSSISRKEIKNILKHHYLFIGASFVLIGGFILNLLAIYKSPQSKIKSITRLLKGNEVVVFLIDNININCSEVVIYSIIKKNSNIYFYVKNDYSDIEIKNFKETFNLRDNFVVKRMNNEWKKIYENINKRAIPLNILIIYKKRENKLIIRRF